MFDVLKRITDLRIARGWSVYKLAKLSDIPQSTIATWYQKNLYPPVDKIEILCNTFGISLSEFFSCGGDQNTALTKDQILLLDNWCLLSEPQRKAVIHVMNVFIHKGHEG